MLNLVFHTNTFAADIPNIPSSPVFFALSQTTVNVSQINFISLYSYFLHIEIIIRVSTDEK